MALRGNLRDFSLPDVFQLVTLSGKTGVLRIKRADAQGSVWFNGGEVFFAQSDWHHEPLGMRLVAAGKLTAPALNRALETRRVEPEGGRRLGQIMVDEGLISGKVLEAFIQEQIQDTIFDLFRWDDGDFDFETLEVAPEEDIGLSVSIENIVMEGSRRLDEWNRLKKKIPSMDIVFKMATAPGEGTFDISLKPIEWHLLLKVDGTRSVAELARDLGRTDFEVARIIYGLFSAGLLEVASDEEVERLRGERAEREARYGVPRPPAPVPAAVPAPAPAPAPSPEAATPTPAPVTAEAAVAVAEIPEPESAPSVEAETAAPVAVAEPAVRRPEPEIQPEPERPSVPVEEPAFLSGPQTAAGADEMAAFDDVMDALLETPTPVAPPVPSEAFEAPSAPEAAEIPAPPSAIETAEGPVLPEALEGPEAEAPTLESPIPPPPVAEEAPAIEVDLFAGEPSIPQPPVDETQPEEAIPVPAAEMPQPEEPPSRPSVVGPYVLEVAEPASITGAQPEPEAPAEAPGDFASDLMALGLGELPSAPPTEESSEPTIAELEEAARAAEASGSMDLNDLLGSLSQPEPPAEPLSTDEADLGGEVRTPEEFEDRSSSGVISTDAFLSDFDTSDVSYATGGFSAELTALTGAGNGRSRPAATASKVPEAGEASHVLQRDCHVDRDTLMRIIEGVKNL